MHILLTGGGTGGHIVPLLAVAHELRLRDKTIRLSYVGEKGGKFTHLTAGETFDARYFIRAGKFRRYHGESFVRKVFDVKTNLLNMRDAFRVAVGCVQAFWLLVRHRPDVIFIKGGFVGVPIGLAAAILRIPYITHDSDAVPGLANRIIARWARVHATGMPAELYAYPKQKTVYVGVPVPAGFEKVTQKRQTEAKQALGLAASEELVLITGGSQGSQRINHVVRTIVLDLLEQHETLHIVHHVGQGNESIYSGFSHERLHIEPFIEAFVGVATAADVVVTRAGANSMAELGMLGKASIVIPSPFLAGGHQLENARHLAEVGAIIELNEESVEKSPERLARAISELLEDKGRARQLGVALHNQTKSGAAATLAELLIKQ